MARLVPFALAFSFGLASLAACSSSDSGGGTTSKDGGGGGGGNDGTSAGKAFAQAYCARLEACAPALLALADGDVATCTSRLALVAGPMVGANGSSLTAGALSACASAIPQVACGDLLSRKTADACKPPAGTLADGAGCAGDAQCAGGRCRAVGGKACGTCGKVSAAGEACIVPDDCTSGLTCVDSKCTALGTQGATCDASHPCRPDFACKGGACSAPTAMGADCTDAAECDATKGGFCSPTSKKCTAVVFDGANQACGALHGELILCGGGGYCSGLSQSSSTGKCLAPAADGASCNTGSGPFCSPGAICACASGGGDAGCSGTCTLATPSSCH